ncbi:hypothetical protein [Streptomyces sp. NPDC001068]|uniref:hypothetical protein n=1 Tax=Streptomyces sp. NPDC001068 TaxID=3364544 RepID=UPI003691591C
MNTNPSTDTPDASGTVVRGVIVGASGADTGPASTSTDTVPGQPDTDTPDTPDTGVRIEYRARVPRRLLGAALLEAFAAIHRETSR